MYQHKCSLLWLKAVNCSQETLSHLFSSPAVRPRVGGNARRDARARMVASVKAKGSALAHLDGRYILRLLARTFLLLMQVARF